MGDVARDCTRSGNDILMKVGVEGRVLLGPAGSPGSFTVPVRIAVRRDSDQKPAAAKLYQVPATIAAGETAGSFTLVTDPIAVPFLTTHADDDYTILVGFDSATKPAAEAAARIRRPHGEAAAGLTHEPRSSFPAASPLPGRNLGVGSGFWQRTDKGEW